MFRIGKLTTSSEKKQLAQNENTPSDVLDLLSQENREIRQLVAGNPNTPIEVLEKLGIEFAEEIVNNPVFDLLLLEDSDSHFLKMCLATSSTTSVEILERLSRDRDRNIRCQVAKNHQTTGDILCRLGEDEDYYVLSSVLENHNTTENTLKKLINSILSNYFTGKILKHPNSSLDILLAAAEHPAGNPRIAVSKCRKTPVPLLVKLSSDNVAYVRRGVAENLKTPAEILTKLSSDNAISVIRAVARNPKTPKSLLSELANHSNKSIRKAVAYNYKTPANILIKLAEDSEPSIRAEVGRNISTPVDVLKQLSRDAENIVRARVAINLNTPRDILCELFGRDGNYACALSFNQNVIADILIEVFINNNIDCNGYRLSGDLQKLENTLDYSTIMNSRYYAINLNYFMSNITFMRNSIRLRIISNNKLPRHILHKLAEHHSQSIRKAVAKHSKTSPDILAKLAKDPIEAVRKAVTENENTPFESLILLTKTVKNYCLRKAIAKNYIKDKDVLRFVLVKLAVSLDWLDRKEAAKNCETPLYILDKLKEDSNEYVKISANNNISRLHL